MSEYYQPPIDWTGVDELCADPSFWFEVFGHIAKELGEPDGTKMFAEFIATEPELFKRQMGRS